MINMNILGIITKDIKLDVLIDLHGSFSCWVNTSLAWLFTHSMTSHSMLDRVLFT